MDVNRIKMPVTFTFIVVGVSIQCLLSQRRICERFRYAGKAKKFVNRETFVNCLLRSSD